MTQLSPHFSLEELTFSQTAARNKINNVPTGQDLENLTNTANKMELVRTLLGNPISINSGYRSAALNKAIKGSSKTSQHTVGEAVDFTCRGFGTPRQIVEKIKNSNIEFDQLIYEFDSWVHISFTSTRPRKQILTIDSAGTRIFA